MAPSLIVGPSPSVEPERVSIVREICTELAASILKGHCRDAAGSRLFLRRSSIASASEKFDADLGHDCLNDDKSPADQESLCVYD